MSMINECLTLYYSKITKQRVLLPVHVVQRSSAISTNDWTILTCAGSRATVDLAGHSTLHCEAIMSLFSLGALIFGDTIKLIDWLKNKGLLASSMDCQKCNNGTAMVFTERTEQGVKGWLYFALHPLSHNEDHLNNKFFFFAKSKLPLNKWVFLLYLWSMDVGVCTAALQAEVSEVTAVDVYQFVEMSVLLGC